MSIDYIALDTKNRPIAGGSRFDVFASRLKVVFRGLETIVLF